MRVLVESYGDVRIFYDNYSLQTIYCRIMIVHKCIVVCIQRKKVREIVEEKLKNA